MAETAEPPPGPTGDVTLVGNTLHISGEADPAAAVFLRSRPWLGEVTTVDMTQAGYLDGETFHLILRCLQQLHHEHPGTRLQVRGPDDRTRHQLQTLGLTDHVDLHT